MKQRNHKASEKRLAGQNEQVFAFVGGEEAEQKPDQGLDEHIQAPGAIDGIHQKAEGKPTNRAKHPAVVKSKPCDVQQDAIGKGTP